MKRNTIWACALIVVAALLAAACGSSNTTNGAKDTTPQSPQVTQAAATSAAATAAAAAPTTAPTAQSRTFTDANGKTLTVPVPPKRVVALSPSVVELMYAVGVPPIARPSSATYPDEAKSLPAIGTSYMPNLEQIAAQTPDFIIADSQIQNQQLIDQLSKFAPVFAVRVQNMADIAASLRTLGALLGKPEEGEKGAKALESQLQTVQAKLPPDNQRPKVFIMVGAGDAFWGAKPDAFAGDVVAKLGAKNLVPSGPDTAPFPGFTTFSLEQIAALDPDVILVISPAPPPAPPTSKMLAGNPAWNNLRAVKANKVMELPPDIMLQGAGPRVGQVIDQLFPFLYPGR